MTSVSKRKFVSLKCIHLFQLADHSSSQATTSTTASGKSQLFTQRGSKVYWWGFLVFFSVLLEMKYEHCPVCRTATPIGLSRYIGCPLGMSCVLSIFEEHLIVECCCRGLSDLTQCLISSSWREVYCCARRVDRNR